MFIGYYTIPKNGYSNKSANNLRYSLLKQTVIFLKVQKPYKLFQYT